MVPSGNKPWPQPMLTEIYVATGPQWVKKTQVPDDVMMRKLISQQWPLVEVFNQSSPMNSPRKGPAMQSFQDFISVNQNKLLNHQSIYWWLETPWRSCVKSLRWRQLWWCSRSNTESGYNMVYFCQNIQDRHIIVRGCGLWNVRLRVQFFQKIFIQGNCIQWYNCSPMLPCYTI